MVFHSMAGLRQLLRRIDDVLIALQQLGNGTRRVGGAANPGGSFYSGRRRAEAGRYPLRPTGHRLAGAEGGEDLPIAGEEDCRAGAAGAAAEKKWGSTAALKKLAGGCVEAEPKMLEKIKPEDRECHGGSQEPPAEALAAQNKCELLVAPALDGRTIRTDQGGAAGRRRRRGGK